MFCMGMGIVLLIPMYIIQGKAAKSLEYMDPGPLCPLDMGNVGCDLHYTMVIITAYHS